MDADAAHSVASVVVVPAIAPRWQEGSAAGLFTKRPRCQYDLHLNKATVAHTCVQTQAFVNVMSLRPVDGDSGVFSLRNVIPSSEGTPIQLGQLGIDNWEHEPSRASETPHTKVVAYTAPKKMFQLNFGTHVGAHGVGEALSRGREVQGCGVTCGRECEARMHAAVQLSSDNVAKTRRSESQVAQLEKQLGRARNELGATVSKYNQASAAAGEERRAMKARIQTDGRLIADFKGKMSVAAQDNGGLIDEMRSLKKTNSDLITAHTRELEGLCGERDELKSRLATQLRVSEGAHAALDTAKVSHNGEFAALKKQYESTRVEVESYVAQLAAATNEHSSEVDVLNETSEKLRESLKHATVSAQHSELSLQRSQSTHRTECDALLSKVAMLEATVSSLPPVRADCLSVEAASPLLPGDSQTSVKNEIVELRATIAEMAQERREERKQQSTPVAGIANSDVLAELSTLRAHMLEVISSVRDSQTPTGRNNLEHVRT